MISIHIDKIKGNQLRERERSILRLAGEGTISIKLRGARKWHISHKLERAASVEEELTTQTSLSCPFC